MDEGGVARVVTYVTRNNFVFRRENDSVLSGICIDLWNRTAQLLNLSYTVDIVDTGLQLVTHFKENRSDIIVQRIDEGTMDLFNLSRQVFSYLVIISK